MSYTQHYEQWRSDPLRYWQQRATALSWTAPPRQIFDGSSGPYGRWFPGGQLNTSYNCLDRHVESGAGERPALIWDSAMTGEVRASTYRELTERVARLAARSRTLASERATVSSSHMPMLPEAAVAMLRVRSPRRGAFGGLRRIRGPGAGQRASGRLAPKVVVTASCGLEPGRIIDCKGILDAALASLDQPVRTCLILQRPQSAGRAHAGP